MKKLIFAFTLLFSILAAQGVSAANLTWVSTPAVVGSDTKSLDGNPDPNVLVGDYNFNKKPSGGNKTHTWVFNVTPSSSVSVYFSVLLGVIKTATLDGNAIASGDVVSLIGGNHTIVLVMKNIAKGAHEQLSIINSIPVPAAIWLFGSAILGLIGATRRKTASSAI